MNDSYGGNSLVTATLKLPAAGSIASALKLQNLTVTTPGAETNPV
jgi:hypothetical protein